MFHSKFFQSKAFIFSLESLIALVLFVSFLQIAYFHNPNQNNMRDIAMKNALSDALFAVDSTGFAIETFDSNLLSNPQKMSAVYSKIDSLLPQNENLRLEITAYDTNYDTCALTQNFDSCFTKLYNYSPMGPAVPTNKTVSHKRILLSSKQPPEQCSIGAVFSPNKTSPAEKLFLEGKAKRLFFDSNGIDLNVFFDARVAPIKASCDDNIHVDINISVPDYTITFGRLPADIAVVLDTSGSMDELTVFRQHLNGGSFNSGTMTKKNGNCNSYGNWQTLATFVSDSFIDGEPKVGVTMSYSGYAGQCNRPRLRVRSPSGTYIPGTNGTSTATPIEIPITNPVLGTYTVQGWSDDSINYDLNLNLQKMSTAKHSASSFIDYNGWKEQYDQLALVSFNTYTYLEQQLLKATDANRTVLKNKIAALLPSGNTAIGDAITTGRTEVTSSRATPGSMRFLVLLSDGQSNTGSNPLTAAQTAKDNNVIVYTIGFGADADHAILGSIASLTGGKYYRADDGDALSEVFTYIAIGIGESLSTQPPEIANDANLLIPLSNCSNVLSPGAGMCIKVSDSNYLYYNIGLLDKDHPWAGTFDLNIPCDSPEACSLNNLILPTPGTMLYWKDVNGIDRPPVMWDINHSQKIDFNYRDLSLNILSAFTIGSSQVSLDLNTRNSGTLSTGATSVDFLLNDPYTGTLLKQEPISALTSGQSVLFLNERLNSSGWLYAVINRSKVVRECPGNNIASIYCSGTSKTQYFVVDAWTWVD